jgi:septal ring factor EnvC (AmiA/AmiB activator)
MSVYTLITFVGYSIILLLIGRVAVTRLEQQESDIKVMTKSITEMQISIAVMATSLKNIESDATETRSAISEINHTLLDKLT